MQASQRLAAYDEHRNKRVYGMLRKLHNTSRKFEKMEDIKTPRDKATKPDNTLWGTEGKRCAVSAQI